MERVSVSDWFMMSIKNIFNLNQYGWLMSFGISEHSIELDSIGILIGSSWRCGLCGAAGIQCSSHKRTKVWICGECQSLKWCQLSYLWWSHWSQHQAHWDSWPGNSLQWFLCDSTNNLLSWLKGFFFAPPFPLDQFKPIWRWLDG